jgi:hypothetical protein
MPDSPPRKILALVRDLIFASKISASARVAQVECRILRDPGALSGQSGDLLLVDLNEPGAIEAASQWQRDSGAPVVGFVSHVDADRIEQARRAGLTRVMARSGFVAALPSLLSGSLPNS